MKPKSPLALVTASFAFLLTPIQAAQPTSTQSAQRWNANLTVRNVLDEYAFRTASGANRLYPEKPIHAILTIETRL
jgi:hypothetical protein